MNTAQEIQFRIAQRERDLAGMRAGLKRASEQLFREWLSEAFGRIVSAKRARLLRKRGEYVRFHGWSTCGKARYRWAKTTEWSFK
jgi:hypothetical protein